MSDELAGLSRADLVREVRGLRSRVATLTATLSRLQRDYRQAVDNLTHAQERGRVHLDEARANRMIAKAPPGRLHALSHFSHERDRQDLVHGPLSALLDHPWGTGEQWEPLLGRIRSESASIVETTGKEHLAMALVEEAIEAVCETDPKKMRAELVQLGALSCKLVELIDMMANRPNGDINE